MDMTTTGPAKPKWRKMAIGMIAGGVAGFVSMMGLTSLTESGVLGELGPSRQVAMLVGSLYILTALIVLAGVISPRVGARFLNVEDADELREQRRLLTCSGLSMVALGLAMMVLAIAAPVGILAPPVALGTFVVLVALATLGGYLQQRDMDEMMRNISREGTVLAFYLLALVGGGWEVLAHVGYAQGPAPLDWVNLFGASILVATMIVVVRRGLATPR